MVQQEEIKLFMRKVGSFVVLCISIGLFMINNSYAKDYQIDYLKSRVVFSGNHADNKFTGYVQKYQSKIIFDKNNLKNSKIEVIFDMNSFKTGNDMYDGTLPSKDWLNVKNYPQGYFKSTKIIDNSGGNFQMEGNLIIKNITKKINLIFILKDLDKSLLNVKSDFKINRLDFDIGRESDDSGEWVDLEIDVSLDLIVKTSYE